MKPRTFTAAERTQLREWWLARTPEGTATWSAAMIRAAFGCSSKTLVKEIRSLGLGLRKPQRKPWEKVA